MSFNAISAPASSDRPSAPASFADSRFHSGAWPSRHDWHVLLDRWKRVQPYADRFATVFLDTLFASGTDFRQLFGSGSLEVQFVRLAHVLTQIVCADSNRDAMHVRVELLVRRFVRDDAGTLRSRALRAAVAATIREVAASEMSTQTRA